MQRNAEPPVRLARQPLSTPIALLRERWLSLRDRMLASPVFQRRAAAFPLTRPIAQARARALFDLCAGFVYSQILLACVRLRLLDRLREGPAEPAELALSMGLPLAAAERLLDAAAAVSIVERRQGGRYGLGIHGAALLGTPAVMAMIEHHADFYADLADPVALLRGDIPDTRMSHYWPYARGARSATEGEVAGYTKLMAATQPLVAQEILDAVSLQHHRCLLDIGGGDGTFLRSVAERAPHVALMLFDLPAVAELARDNIRTAGLDERTSVFGGDFALDALPGGADVVTLVRVIHDHDDAKVRILLRKTHDALQRGGRLVIAEPLAETPGAETVGHAYFGFYLLAMGSGRPRSFAELSALLREAGFSSIQKIDTRLPLQVSVITAER